ncbi:ABC-2 type transport system permease protein [Actinoplanes octamycinicus]|uniref:Transport permease protein n=1 Tax=Actinoplanes octamycinicus TaxID=135948 RepID=A0A7W7GYC7_9ACTN|nr:ABC transporter permease [Actinoplanes octamycinicus]MBB4740392.1 ABC-2 type transport system permease protein [Actinoplanes octamycinicus]GIE59653.1 transport permease protein [Actinoplanes octamycinicus]
MQLVRQTGLILRRTARTWYRSPVAIFVGFSGPLIYLVLFGPLLEGSLGGDPWQWFVPGMLMQLTVFGAAYAGFSLTPELRNGVMERLWVAPVSRMALLLGRVLSDVAQLTLQGVLLLAVAVALGFRTSLPAMICALALAALLGAGLSAASYAMALRIREENRFAPLLSMLLLPLMLLSGVLLPMESAPGWLHALSLANPLTYVVDALRAITAQQYATDDTLTGLAVTAGLGVLCTFWGLRAMAREQT